RVDRAAQLRLAAEPGREGDVRELDPETAAQLAQAAELMELPEAGQPGSGARTGRGGETRAAEGAEQPGPPARLGGGASDGKSFHATNLNTNVSRSLGRAPPSTR